MRLGLSAEWAVDGMSDWGVTGWRFFGRAFPLGEGRLRLGIAGFYGDAGRVAQPRRRCPTPGAFRVPSRKLPSRWCSPTAGWRSSG